MNGIRRVRHSDAANICRIYNPYVTGTDISFESEPLDEKTMTERIDEISSHCPWLVYEEDGVVTGFCYVHPWKVRAAYSPTMESSIYLSPEAEGRGVGKGLMLALIDECRRIGVHSIIACITADNARSIRFHERLGFRTVSRFREVGRKFGRWLDVVDMQFML